MKKSLFFFVSVIVCWSFSSLTLAANFPDIGGHIYQDSIQYLANNDVVQWYPDGTFWPDREISRAEITTIIMKASSDQEITGADCFPDVTDQRYAPFVCFAQGKWTVKWYPDGTFKPAQNVLIAEWLVIGVRWFNHESWLSDTNDQRRYEPYLQFVHDNNIFSKFSLRPEKNMTRGEMAYLTHQFMLERDNEIEFTGVRESKSLGCGLEQPRSAPTSTVVDGITRNYISVVWNTYDKDTPIPLVLAFHGRTNSNSDVRGYYKIEEATNGNAIVIYPSGLPENSSPRNRRANGDSSDSLRDFELFDNIVEQFTSQYCVDLDQIYVVGHSLGARFSNSLACARGDVIRAVGSVGGSTTINECSGPVAAMIMHNPDDRLASFAWWVVARDQLTRQNACGPTTATRSIHPDGNCVEYTDCQNGANVTRCPHSDSTARNGTYYPHTRPDFAGKEIWEFFQGLE